MADAAKHGSRRGEVSDVSVGEGDGQRERQRERKLTALCFLLRSRYKSISLLNCARQSKSSPFGGVVWSLPARRNAFLDTLVPLRTPIPEEARGSICCYITRDDDVIRCPARLLSHISVIFSCSECAECIAGVGPVSEDDLSRSPYPAGASGRRGNRGHRSTLSRTMGGTSKR